MTVFKKSGGGVGRFSSATSPSGKASITQSLRVIGGNYANATTLTLDPWEPLEAGDLVLLFAANSANSTAMTAAGFTLVLDYSFASSRLALFSYTVTPTGLVPAISIANATRISSLIYRGAAGVGASTMLGAASSNQHGISLAISSGALVAAATVRPDVNYAGSANVTAGLLGWCNLGGNSGGLLSAGTTLRPKPSAVATTPTLQFNMLSSTQQNMIAVEVLPA